MLDSKTAQGYYGRIKEIINQIRIYGENMSNKKVAEKNLVSLTKKYDAMVTAIEQSEDITTLSMIELVGSLEAYEQRLIRHNESSLENTFQSKANLKSQNFKKKFAENS